MRKRITAGGVVIKDNMILLIKHREDGKLGFPKGWVGEGESIEEAAVRETEEETGIQGLQIVKKLGAVKRVRFEDYTGKEVLKIINLFLMTADSYEQDKAEEENGWFEFEEALSKMKYVQEAEFLQQIADSLL